jgi:hypothetical protein
MLGQGSNQVNACIIDYSLSINKIYSIFDTHFYIKDLNHAQFIFDCIIYINPPK